MNFTAPQYSLDDGSPHEAGRSLRTCPASRLLGDPKCAADSRPELKAASLVDLGCLEGGYAIEFARLGMKTSSASKCGDKPRLLRFARSKVDLPNLKFIRTMAWALTRYGRFDVIYCTGHFLPFDQPRRFLDCLPSTAVASFLDTH